MKNKPGNKNRLSKRREDILRSAGSVFSAKGYAAATVDEIAHEAGIAKGSVYNYFPSKQDILTQLLRHTAVKDEAFMDGLVAADLPAREKIGQLLHMFFDQFVAFQQIGRLVLEFWVTAAGEAGRGTFATTLREMYRRYHQRLVSILLQGQREGDFVLEHGPDIGAALITAVIDGMQIQAMMELRTDWSEEYRSALEQAIWDALTAGKLRSDKKA